MDETRPRGMTRRDLPSTGIRSPATTAMLQPFHIDTANGGECTNDINHSWAPQHTYWNGGPLDQFVTGHLAVDGPANGAL